MKHREIRAAILSALKENISERVTWFDGRPVFIDEQELPAVAVYLTDASATEEFVDEGTWEAVLHIEVFLRAKETDSVLDMWMEEKILPALEAVPGLSELLLKMNLQGYDYRRDDEYMMWGSADLQWNITYQM
ncbi:phage tail protein [Escherichia coli]|uniref:phage minor tail U family protein n=1 Tax=Escherichia coli TaxID=562 RepID=UPI001DCE2308|nr:phage minor tail U family protein [Escherichia coli]EEW0271079.1 phage tail protein [Escherichia coli]EFP0782993.1 phage tail protein [Escherichia coli]EKZ3306720.1 phage tail protein [Escherichia coli]ELD1533855.1 phage tail protein [Escherichia coli]MBZ9128283.1 phage tail protein [Escherichia coli]